MNSEGDESVSSAIRLEQQRREMTHAVGHCVLSWAGVEHTLSLLFNSLLGFPPDKGFQMWDSIVSLEARLSLLNVVISHELRDTELRGIWNKLMGRVSKKYKKRHEIAHGTILMVGSDKVVFVPYGTISSMIASDGKRLTEEDIYSRASSFTELAGGIAWLQTAVNVRRHNVSATLPPMPDLVLRLQKPTDQTRVGT